MQTAHLSAARVSFSHYILVVGVALSIWALFLPQTYDRNTWIYSWDSAPYLETANSILEGRGLVHRPTFGLDAEIWEPLKLWPPGYSVLVAAVQACGASGTSACLLVSLAAAALSLATIGYIFLRRLNWMAALLLTSSLAASVQFQALSVQCLSDAAFLALAGGSLACLLRWSDDSDASSRWVFWAGLLAGGAWATRNAGVALFAATAIFFAVHLASRPIGWIARRAAIWIAATSIVIVPVLLRNVAVFGQIQPYHMPPSRLTFLENVRHAGAAVVEDLTASRFLAERVSGQLALVVLAVFISIAWYAWKYGPPVRRMQMLERRRVELLLGAYAAVYLALLVVARTKYQWGEIISARYSVQVTWILWLLLALSGAAALKRLNWAKIDARACVVLFCGVIAALHLKEQWQVAAHPLDRSEALEGRLGESACAHLQDQVASDQVVLSTRAYILRIHCDVNARVLPEVERADAYRKAITREEIKAASAAGILWGIVIEDVNAAKFGKFGIYLKEVLENPENHRQWKREPVPGPAIILRYAGESEEGAVR